jgi:hypothetical protein
MGAKKGKQPTEPPAQTDTPPPPPDSSSAPPSTQPSDLQLAAAAMQKAQKAAIAKFESSPEWTAAATELETDRAAVEAETDVAAASLKADPDYQKALDASAKAEKDLDDQRANAGVTPEEITEAANKAMVARSAVSQMKLEASSKDPKLVADKAKLSKATTAMNELRKGEKAAVEADPDWQAAKKDYDDAKAKRMAAASK